MPVLLRGACWHDRRNYKNLVVANNERVEVQGKSGAS